MGSRYEVEVEISGAYAREGGEDEDEDDDVDGIDVTEAGCRSLLAAAKLCLKKLESREGEGEDGRIEEVEEAAAMLLLLLCHLLPVDVVVVVVVDIPDADDAALLLRSNLNLSTLHQQLQQPYAEPTRRRRVVLAMELPATASCCIAKCPTIGLNRSNQSTMELCPEILS